MATVFGGVAILRFIGNVLGGFIRSPRYRIFHHVNRLNYLNFKRHIAAIMLSQIIAKKAIKK